jgi:pantothenate kinase
MATASEDCLVTAITKDVFLSVPSLLENPVEHLLLQLESNTSRYMIGMAGLPGSGKSTLATRLADEVNARAGSPVMVALGMDGFHLTKAQLQQMPHPQTAFTRRGSPWTFDPAGMAQRLRMLCGGAGKTIVEWPDFQHDVGDPVEAAHLVSPSVRLILVEGLYLLHEVDGWDEVVRCFDERWYLDTPMELAMERLANRHMAAWGLTREAAVARIASNDGLNAHIVAATSERADWRVMSKNVNTKVL